MPKIQRIEREMKPCFQRKKVAAYARVSLDTDKLMHSLSAQISFYSELIQSNPEWEEAGVYADAGITGTDTKDRLRFQEMIADCEAGKIDIILTKSISRFARNTVDLLSTVRHLKDLGVEVRFEREHVNTFTADGEVMLSILASFAEQESISLSQNIKWRVRKKYEQGQPHAHLKLFGYRWEGDERVIEPDEAEIVRFIFSEYLDGKTFKAIAEELDAKGVKSVNGKEKFHPMSVRRIIGNEEYTGCQIYQMAYAPSPRKLKLNHGEVPMYRVDDHHEAIIDPETFAAAQAMRVERGKNQRHEKRNPSAYTGMVWCGKCGAKVYLHSVQHGQFRYWSCDAKKTKKSCDAHNWRDDDLLRAVQEAIGTEKMERKLKQQVKRIVLFDDHLEIEMMNGRKRNGTKSKGHTRYDRSDNVSADCQCSEA